MNPLTNVKNIQKLNEKVLQMGVEDNASWHKQYKDSAYVFIGGMPYDLTEGDILCVFSQYGEIVDINLVRDKSSGKSKGYGFLCYEDQRSTILAVDNLNGIKLGGRTIRVDHVANYKRPKGDERDEKGERKELPLVGCAPTTPPGSDEDQEEGNDMTLDPRKKKKKKEKTQKRPKENKKNIEMAGKERKQGLSSGQESILSKIAKLDQNFEGNSRKRCSDERGDQDRSHLEKHRKSDYKDSDRETNRRRERRERDNERQRGDNERGKDRDRKRYEDTRR
ncbi:RNA-binding motif protein, X-linked 2-like [Dendronephthya gigantea]|uniref:RNA-binding motif protein, X-linked 2-like n=1 Tax=Dendronephthya gigantea TaxID=151771 RepID=UPI0010697230|nr:RNA-binding motif protein, X-linked 2-like [Dendronephthya gigantea]